MIDFNEIQIKELPVSEKNYAETMQGKVEPYLESIREDGFFSTFDSNKLHYEKYVIDNAVASVVIVHGFTESAEKFREMSYCFTLMGFNVFVLDQRGHGKSYRIAENPETVSVGKFEDYVKDLDAFVNEVVKGASGSLPLYVYCHSMGGAVTIQYLQEHPETFKKAVLSAPMVLCKCNGIPPKIASAMMKFFLLFGKDDEMVFVYKGFDKNRSFETSHDTSKARFDYYHAKRCKDRQLQTSSASYRWVSEAIKVANKNLDKNRCAKIKIPLLLCQPEEDASVYSEKEDEFIKLVPNGKLVKFTKCKHEIYLSVDETVFEYLKTIEGFLKG